ncbi:M23 family metallopeptidase [Teredinibacter turnerae]|uniref:M23 family metallopeptidase n=1 Tax=Teredinibacter turnerae TaxID=2426 RepID=UPI000371E931|nr:M23 family metallopeptidase [Teredinibacter turnerae]
MVTRLAVLLFAFAAVVVRAESAQLPLEIKGDWLPGAMLFGHTVPEATVSVMNKTLTADAKGNFVFGLGRDAKGEQTVTVSKGGTEFSAQYTVQPRQYDIQRITGVEQKYVEPPEDVLARIQEDSAQVANARRVLSRETHYREPFIWPAEGPVTGVYGSQRVFNGVPKRPHFGLDIAGPVGTTVVAPAGGVVVLVAPDMYYSGGTLIVDHGYGITSTFIHLSKILVKPGARVRRGQKIALIGSTGRATGPHLDWRVNWFDERLDPALLLPDFASRQAEATSDKANTQQAAPEKPALNNR